MRFMSSFARKGSQLSQLSSTPTRGMGPHSKRSYDRSSHSRSGRIVINGGFVVRFSSRMLQRRYPRRDKRSLRAMVDVCHRVVYGVLDQDLLFFDEPPARADRDVRRIFEGASGTVTGRPRQALLNGCR